MMQNKYQRTPKKIPLDHLQIHTPPTNMHLTIPVGHLHPPRSIFYNLGTSEVPVTSDNISWSRSFRLSQLNPSWSFRQSTQGTNWFTMIRRQEEAERSFWAVERVLVLGLRDMYHVMKRWSVLPGHTVVEASGPRHH